MRYVCSDPASFLHPAGRGSPANASIAARILGIHCRSIARKSFVADLANSMRKEAIGYQLFFELRQGNTRFIAAFRHAGQVGYILH